MTAPTTALVAIPPEVDHVRWLLQERRRERDEARYSLGRAETDLKAMTTSRGRWFGTAVVIGLLGIFSAAGGTIAALDALDDMKRQVADLKAENDEQDHVIEQLNQRLDGLAARMPTI